MTPTCRAFATRTSCPQDARSRLTQGEWVPTSQTIRQAGWASNCRASAVRVVGRRPSVSTTPSGLSSQNREYRSPRSSPIVIVDIGGHLWFVGLEPVKSLEDQTMVPRHQRLTPSHLNLKCRPLCPLPSGPCARMDPVYTFLNGR